MGNKPEKRVIFRAWITTKGGQRIYARNYGIKAFPIVVDEEGKVLESWEGKETQTDSCEGSDTVSE